MANRFGIPEEVERRIRQRDEECVYCRKTMTNPKAEGSRTDWVTIEHLRERGPFYWKDGLKEEDLAICCWSCNSSRGKKRLLDWFRVPYCSKRNINEKMVARPVKDYIRRNHTNR